MFKFINLALVCVVCWGVFFWLGRVSADETNRQDSSWTIPAMMYQANRETYDFKLLTLQPFAKSETSHITDSDLYLFMEWLVGFLSIPKSERWVNLAPQESQRILPATLQATAIGQTLLEQDMRLKQTTAQLWHPDHPVGRQYWAAFFDEVSLKRKPGLSDDHQTGQRVWIVPDRTDIEADQSSCYIREALFKVVTQDQIQLADSSPSASGLFDRIMIPQLNTAVNYNAEFAQLRRMYRAMIFSEWLKSIYVDDALAQVVHYGHHLLPQHTYDTHTIFQQYMTLLSQDKNQYILEHYDPLSQTLHKHKLVTGGVQLSSGSSPAMVMGQPSNFLQNLSQQGSVYWHPITLNLEAQAVEHDRMDPHRVLTEVLGLNAIDNNPNISMIDEQIVEHAWRVRRIHIRPQTNTVTHFGLNLLAREMVNGDADAIEYMDLVYDSDRLLAVLPVITKTDGNRFTDQTLYLNLIPYLYSMSDIRMDEDILASLVERNDQFLAWLSQRYPYGAPKNLLSTSDKRLRPFVMAHFENDDGDVVTYPLGLKEAAESLHNPDHPFYDDVDYFMFPILPTVYPPTEGRFESDAFYYKAVSKFVDGPTTVLGPGSGFDAWIAGLVSGQPVTAIGLNPLEVANTHVTLSSGSIDHRVEAGRGLRNDEGQWLVDFGRVDWIIWNMPDSSEGLNAYDPQRRLSDFWDNDASSETLKRFSYELSDYLNHTENRHTRALVWNGRLYRPDVHNMLRSAGRTSQFTDPQELDPAQVMYLQDGVYLVHHHTETVDLSTIPYIPLRFQVFSQEFDQTELVKESLVQWHRFATRQQGFLNLRRWLSLKSHQLTQRLQARLSLSDSVMDGLTQLYERLRLPASLDADQMIEPLMKSINEELQQKGLTIVLKWKEEQWQVNWIAVDVHRDDERHYRYVLDPIVGSGLNDDGDRFFDSERIHSIRSIHGQSADPTVLQDGFEQNLMFSWDEDQQTKPESPLEIVLQTLDLMHLEDHDRLNIVKDVVDSSTGLNIKRIRILPRSDPARIPMGLEILQNELMVDHSRGEPTLFDLIFDEDHLIGIVPSAEQGVLKGLVQVDGRKIVLKRNDPQLRMVRYFDFSFVQDWPDQNLHSNPAMLNWAQLSLKAVQRSEKLRRYLEQHHDMNITAVGSDLGFTHLLAVIHDDQRWETMGIDLREPMSLPIVRMRIQSSDPYVITPILPTVYPQVLGKASADKSYYESLQRVLKPHDQAMVIGPGTGVESWLVGQITGQPIEILGINPFEVANTHITLQASGLSHRVAHADNLISADGRLHRPDVDVDWIVWNMPTIEGVTPPLHLNRPLAMHWDHDSSLTVLRRFAFGVSQWVNRTGHERTRSLIWNGTEYDERVYRILASSGEGYSSRSPENDQLQVTYIQDGLYIISSFNQPVDLNRLFPFDWPSPDEVMDDRLLFQDLQQRVNILETVIKEQGRNGNTWARDELTLRAERYHPDEQSLVGIWNDFIAQLENEYSADVGYITLMNSGFGQVVQDLNIRLRDYGVMLVFLRDGIDFRMGVLSWSYQWIREDVYRVIVQMMPESFGVSKISPMRILANSGLIMAILRLDQAEVVFERDRGPDQKTPVGGIDWRELPNRPFSQRDRPDVMALDPGESKLIIEIHDKRPVDLTTRTVD
jgi:hypothetical protein